MYHHPKKHPFSLTHTHSQMTKNRTEQNRTEKKNIKNKLFIRIFFTWKFVSPLSLSLVDNDDGSLRNAFDSFFLFFSIVKNTRVGYFFLDCVTAKNKNMYSFSPCICVPCDLLLIGCFSLWMCVCVSGWLEKKC